MSDSETIYSESERSEDEDSEGSLADFVVDDDDEPEACPSCHAEICVSNIITKKRRHAEVIREESEDDEDDESDDSSSDYVPSEVDDSSSEGSESASEGDE